jgi:polyhydroxybutyrate depolymerase
MDVASDRDGYLVAYPDGTRISTVLDPDPVAGDAQYGWNAGQCCGLPTTQNVNDVGFLMRVISDIAVRTPVDTRRVYVTGMSNGGMMAYTMASRAARHITAVASVAGQVQLGSLHPVRPVPTMEFHSVDDPNAKWAGVAARDARRQFSVLQGIDKWVLADGCPATPHTAPTIIGPTGSTSAGETATLITYGPCRDGTEVALWKFTGSGHVWPGSPLNTGPPDTWVLGGVGRGITLVNANDAMWEFFRQYSLPG